MKQTFLSILISALLLITPFAASAKEMVAVMDFSNKAQRGGSRVGRGASDMLATALVKSAAFRVMERDKVNTVLKEQNFGKSGRVDASTAVQVGKILGVKYIITGAVTEYGESRSGGGGGGVNVNKKGYQATVDIRILDAETGEIVFADTASDSKSSFNVRVFGFGGGESFNEKHASKVLRGAINKLSEKITGANLVSHTAAKAKPKGMAKVADVDGKEVTLNQGSNAGFEVGQVVKISRKGKTIKDPDTGKVIKIKYKTMGKVKLTTVEGSYAEGEITSGDDIKTGDVVK